MRRPMVWLSIFAAGIVFGIIVGRDWHEADAPEPRASPSANNSGAPASPAEAVLIETTSAKAPVVAARPPDPAQTGTANPGAEGPAAPDMPVQSGKDAYALPVDSGVVSAIDAGDVFNKQIARPSTADSPNQLGDAHRELEREPRDDGWAYTMEAELQNSMLTATSTGQFKMEHVECRTTICEVRVSGNGNQADDVRNWSNSVHTNTFNQQLFMNVSSTISSHERVDAIYIFRRPARTR